LTVFSPILGIFGYSKPIANIANDLRAIGIFGYSKPIANLANVTSSPRHQARVARHGSLCRSDQSIVLFARSFLLLAFCWRSPPPGPTAWPVGAGGSTRNFFIFDSPTAH
jgi:hypothetical protein